jgi:SlyX protein
MHSTDTTDQRLTALEIKASFTEDLLEQLDLVVIRQQQQIDLLVREVARLQQRHTDGQDSPRHSTDDLPPHY